MKSLEIQRKVLILDIEEKEKVNVYTFVDLTTNETNTVVGVKGPVTLHQVLQANISVRLTRQVLELVDGSKRYLTEAQFFITKLEQI